MTDLSLLRTSLTKHGAHKLAILLGNYATAEVMSSLTGAEPGVNIDKPQARANLSVDRNGNVPLVWDRAKAAGSEAVGGLVLIGIILSHGDLISAFRRGARSLFRGTLTRGEVISGKSFTNTANSVEVLGYSTSHTREHVEYNFARLFEIPGLHELTLELVLLKFKGAKWDGSTNLLDEIDRKSTRLNSSHRNTSRMPSSA